MANQSDATDDEEIPRELREAIDAADDSEYDDQQEDDEIDIDPRSEKFGYYAGGIITAIMGLLFFVGPWRWINVTTSGGAIPFELRETGGQLLFFAPLIIALIAACVGFAYRITTEDIAENYTQDIVVGVMVVQVFVVGLLYFGLVSIQSVLVFNAEGIVTAATVFGIGLVSLAIFTSLEFIAMALYLGLPCFIGVYAGSLVGGLVE